MMNHEINGYISFYPCQDLAVTRSFYEKKLGLKLVRDQGSCLIFKVAAQAYIGFCQHEGDMPAHQGVIITLLIDEVDEAYQQLQASGIEIEGQPKTNEQYQIHHFFARDPNGYRLELQRFLEPLTS